VESDRRGGRDDSDESAALRRVLPTLVGRTSRSIRLHRRTTSSMASTNRIRRPDS